MLNAVIRLFFGNEAPTGKSTQEGAGRGRLEPGRHQAAPAQEPRATKNRMAQALLWQNDLCKVFVPGYEREKCWLSSFLPYFLLPSFHKKEMSKSLQMSPTSAGHRVLWKLAQKPLIPLGTAPLEVFVHISAKISASVHIYVVIRALFPNNNVGIS